MRRRQRRQKPGRHIRSGVRGPPGQNLLAAISHVKSAQPMPRRALPQRIIAAQRARHRARVPAPVPVPAGVTAAAAPVRKATRPRSAARGQARQHRGAGTSRVRNAHPVRRRARIAAEQIAVTVRRRARVLVPASAPAGPMAAAAPPRKLMRRAMNAVHGRPGQRRRADISRARSAHPMRRRASVAQRPIIAMVRRRQRVRVRAPVPAALP